MRVDGLWVHQGSPDPGANWEGILEDVRVKSDAPPGLKSEDQEEKSGNDRAIRYIINWSEEDQCYVGRCPCLFLGGVHGNDPEEVFKEIRKLAAWVIETQPVKTISECLGSVDSPAGRQRVEDYLKSRPFPHYEASGSPELLIRINEDGSRTLGRFIKCQFEPFGPLPEGFKFDRDEANAR